MNAKSPFWSFEIQSPQKSRNLIDLDNSVITIQRVTERVDFTVENLQKFETKMFIHIT